MLIYRFIYLIQVVILFDRYPLSCTLFLTLSQRLLDISQSLNTFADIPAAPGMRRTYSVPTTGLHLQSSGDTNDNSIIKAPGEEVASRISANIRASSRLNKFQARNDGRNTLWMESISVADTCGCVSPIFVAIWWWKHHVIFLSSFHADRGNLITIENNARKNTL